MNCMRARCCVGPTTLCRTCLLAAAFGLPLARKPTTLLPALCCPWPLGNASPSVQGMLHMLRSELATLAPTSTAQEPPPASKNLARQASPALLRCSCCAEA